MPPPIGHVFGRLTVVGPANPIYHGGIPYTSWECSCACGEQHVVRTAHSLRNGGTRSCGCLRREANKIRPRKRTYSAREAAARVILNRYKQSARSRNLRWRLTDEDAIVLVTSNCYYCGSKPSKRLYTNTKTRRSGLRTDVSHYEYGGIDRKHNHYGYTKANCVPCCSWCNRAKLDERLVDFMSWCQRLTKHVMASQQRMLSENTGVPVDFP